MKKLLKILTLLVLSVSLLQAAAFEKTANGGGVTAVISSDKPLTTGNNTLHVSIKDPQYKDAAVALKVFMPEMPGMPPMEMQSNAKAMGNGIYKTDINFSMSGTWQVWIFITPKSGQKVRIKTSLNI
ncbi:MAG: FixH family protein [Thiovulaceae bacterium]|nr:FixH family protein [Sulfurimonadaceae bacterium]